MSGMTGMEKRNMMKGLLFISPYIVGFSLFTAYPILISVYYSFCDYSVLEPPVWIGLDNYKVLMQDGIFWKSLWNTFIFAAFSIPMGIIAAVMLALLLHTKIKLTSFFRTVFFLPSLVPIVAMSIMWMRIFNPEVGILNGIIHFLTGLEGPNWLGDESWAKPALIMMTLWGVGNAIVTYLAGLQEIPESLIEAAQLDGANAFQRTIHVTLPMLSPVIYFNFIMGIIGSLQVFAQSYVMTGGGPARSTLFYTYYLYQKAFEDYQMGYASAMAWILFAVILVLTVWAQHISKKYVYYRGGA